MRAVCSAATVRVLFSFQTSRLSLSLFLPRVGIEGGSGQCVRWFCGALFWPFRACPSPGGSRRVGPVPALQRVLGSSPRPVLVKISDKKRGENRKAKRKEAHPEARALAEDKRGGKRKRKLEEEKHANTHSRKRRTVECVWRPRSFMADNPTRNKYKYVSSTLSLSPIFKLGLPARCA